jgi:hypothetical protein
LLFVLLRVSPKLAFFSTFVWVANGFLCWRRRGAGLLGATIAFCIFLVGLVTAIFAEDYYFGKPGAFDSLGPEVALLAEAACGLIWGFVVGTVLHFSSELPKRYIDRLRLTDDSCGPIVWRPLDDTPDADSDLR